MSQPAFDLEEAAGTARGNAFNGEVNWVEIDVDKVALDQDHILTGEERFHVALALQ